MNEIRARCGANLQQLLDWAVGMRAADIPAAVLTRAARILADDMAAMIGARDEPQVVAFHRWVLARGGTPQATIWRGGVRRADTQWAAVANAVAADWLELDEGYRPTPCHAGLYVLPALLATAEAERLPCDELLRALVLGYEIVTRIARTWTVPAVTMQSHGRYGAIGAAAAVGLASGLDRETLLAAVSGAATLIGPAPRNHLAEGALVRNVWPATGAWSGLMSVEWARCGIGGIPEGVFDVYSTVLGGQAHPQRLVEGLGEEWAVLECYTKIYACCQHLHSAVEAALELRAAQPQVADARQIEAIQVQTHPLALPLVNANPQTTLGAKFSMPHAVAAALLRGDAGAASFAAPTLQDPALAALRERVATSAWSPALPPPHDRPARVTVRTRDGGQYSADCLSARGGSDRPLPTDVWRDKLRELAQPAYPAIVAVFDEIVGGDAARRRQPWPDAVRAICEGAPAGAV